MAVALKGAESKLQYLSSSLKLLIIVSVYGLECYQREKRVLLNVNGLHIVKKTRYDYLINLCSEARREAAYCTICC